ncbi:MAG: hypothetical protein ACJ77K_19345 [Bacteroidia bacterium]
MEEGGAVSLGVAILIILYIMFIKEPKRRNIPKDAVYVKPQSDASEFWRGKSEDEYKWYLNTYRFETGYEFKKNNPKPQPGGIADYFEYLKKKYPYPEFNRELEDGKRVANDQPIR